MNFSNQCGARAARMLDAASALLSAAAVRASTVRSALLLAATVLSRFSRCCFFCSKYCLQAAP